MALPPKKPTIGSVKSEGRPKKVKQPTQKTPQQRIKILGGNGKTRWEWRDWS